MVWDYACYLVVWCDCGVAVCFHLVACGCVCFSLIDCVGCFDRFGCDSFVWYAFVGFDWCCDCELLLLGLLDRCVVVYCWFCFCLFWLLFEFCVVLLFWIGCVWCGCYYWLLGLLSFAVCWFCYCGLVSCGCVYCGCFMLFARCVLRVIVLCL